MISGSIVAERFETLPSEEDDDGDAAGRRPGLGLLLVSGSLKPGMRMGSPGLGGVGDWEGDWMATALGTAVKVVPAEVVAWFVADTGGHW